MKTSEGSNIIPKSLMQGCALYNSYNQWFRGLEVCLVLSAANTA